jgi:chromosome partitioning protein
MLTHKPMQVLVLGIDVDNVEIGTYQILEHSNTPAEAIINVQLNVDIIPSHIDLVALKSN